MLHIRPIRDEASYEAALAEVEGYFDHEPARSDRGLRRALLADRKCRSDRGLAPHNAIDRPKRDLAEVIGSRPRAWELIRRKRRLNLDQICMITRTYELSA